MASRRPGVADHSLTEDYHHTGSFIGGLAHESAVNMGIKRLIAF